MKSLVCEKSNIFAYQKCRVDDLWVGMVKKKDEAWQAALVFYDGSSVQGVCSEVSQLVHHSLCIYLRTHGASCLDGMLIKPTSILEKNTGSYFQGNHQFCAKKCQKIG